MNDQQIILITLTLELILLCSLIRPQKNDL